MILCQITSRQVRDSYAVPLDDSDFSEGGLRHPSNVRPNRIFTADRHIILYRIGELKPEKLDEVIGRITAILKA